MNPDLQHLHDHVDLFTSALVVRLGNPDDALVIRAVEQFETARQAIAARETAEPAPSASLAWQRLGLAPREQQIVWFLATLALNPRARTLLQQLTGEPTADPSLSGIRNAIYGLAPGPGAFDELGRTGRLRRLGIIERSDRGDAHESRWTWTLSARMLRVLHGDAVTHGDEVGALAEHAPELAVTQLALAEHALHEAREAMRVDRGVVLVAGLPFSGRSTLLVAAARERGLCPLVIDARRLAAEEDQLARQLRAIALECTLLARVPLLANLDALVDDRGGRIELVGSELVAALDGPILVTCGGNRPTIRWDRPVIAVEMGPPPTARLARLWSDELGNGWDDQGEVLAARYPLAPALIHHAARAARSRAAGEPVTPEHVAAGVRTVLDDRLGQYARRVTVTQTWDDLVIPEDQLDAILELMARVRARSCVYEQWGFASKLGRGLGVSALFSGPPGTGKTMVAALIARELGLELYQVDLGKVVSKWLGETEKNLAAVFDAAEAGHAVLLFDEADALFGKRTDVKSSNDRYANLETNYLLQRLESFTGICLLTSNHERSIDPAFKRRLSLHLRFEPPDVDERIQLWRAMLPKPAPVAGDIDFAELARRFAMTGGHIRNAALRAAFLAADEGSQITAVHLEHAARVECEALGKLVL